MPCMEIVINDTNILIDLFNANLLTSCKHLNIEFRTLDVIIEEITVEDQRRAINCLIADGTLKVCSLTSEQVAVVFEKISHYEGTCNLSPEDISVMVYAIDNKCRLLTGDKTLRDKASLENVTVSGVLYLIDELLKNEIVAHVVMIRSLELLLETNDRLPKKLIRERIETLRKTSNDPVSGGQFESGADER